MRRDKDAQKLTEIKNEENHFYDSFYFRKKFKSLQYKVKSIPIILGCFVAFIAAIFAIPSVKEKMFYDPEKNSTEMLYSGEISADNIDSNGRFAMWEWALKNLWEPNQIEGSGTGKLQKVFYELQHPFGTIRICHTTEMDKAEIVVAPVGDDCDSYFLTHAIMLAFMIASCGHGTLLFHSSAIIYGGKAYLFQGKSGTGKSTHSRMWLENIAGAELLNDDNPVVRISSEDVAIAYGSPWSGKTHCYRNIAVPVGAFVRIARAKENNLVRLKPLKAYASLTPSVFSMPFLNDRLREVRHKTLERLVMSVPCCEMHCLPNADAAHTCMNSLLNL